MNADTILLIAALWLLVLCSGLAWLAIYGNPEYTDEYEDEFDPWKEGK